MEDHRTVLYFKKKKKFYRNKNVIKIELQNLLVDKCTFKTHTVPLQMKLTEDRISQMK